MDIRNEIVDTIMLKMQNVIDELAMDTTATAVMSKLETQNKTLIGAVMMTGGSRYGTEKYRF